MVAHPLGERFAPFHHGSVYSPTALSKCMFYSLLRKHSLAHGVMRTVGATRSTYTYTTDILYRGRGFQYPAMAEGDAALSP